MERSAASAISMGLDGLHETEPQPDDGRSREKFSRYLGADPAPSPEPSKNQVSPEESHQPTTLRCAPGYDRRFTADWAKDNERRAADLT